MKHVLPIVLAGTLLCGCAGAGKDTSNRLEVAKSSDISTLNSMMATDSFSFEVIAAMEDGLVAVNGEDKIIPALAESWDVTEDGLTYTFHLRDAEWNNGDPVTADDFVFAWNHMVEDPTCEYGYLFGTDGACIKGADEILAQTSLPRTGKLDVQAKDSKTLVVHLSKSCPYFLSLMTFPVFYPVNEAFYKAQGDQFAMGPDKILSNGPFELEDWVVGSTITMDKNESYWDADNVSLDGLDFRVVPDTTDGILAYTNGQVDWALLDSTLLEKYKEDEGYGQSLGGSLWYLCFNEDNDALKNENLRKAISLVVDRKDLADNVLKNGSLPMGGFVPGEFAYGPDGTDFRDDAGDYYLDYGPDTIQEAKEYWEKAKKELGTDAVEIKFLFDNAEPKSSAATYIQHAIESNLDGVTLQMDGLEAKDRIAKVDEGAFDVVLMGWSPDYADPTTFLKMETTGNPYNYSHYSSKEFDALMRKADTETDMEARWQDLIQAEKVLMEDLPVVGVYQEGRAELTKPNVSDIETHVVGTDYIFKNADKAEE